MDLEIPGPIFSYFDIFEKVNFTEEPQYHLTLVVIKHIFIDVLFFKWIFFCEKKLIKI